MSGYSNINDYSRYFSPRQKVYLVNMSAERNSDIYESLSAVVTSSSMDSIELMMTHAGQNAHDSQPGNATYKLTSQSLGSGLQVLADLTGIVDGNIFQFRMRGVLEMFQRRSIPRIEISARIFQLRSKLSFEFFKKEWERVMAHLRNNSELPGLVMQETMVNLSAGGIGLAVDAKKTSTPLSMFFIALDDGPPVCALAETVWERPVDDGMSSGFRFIQILKADQERINNCISDLVVKSGGVHLDYKRNWVLVDKMVADTRKSE